MLKFLKLNIVYFILLSILILLLISIHLRYNRKESFLGVRNIPTDIGTQYRKRVLYETQKVNPLYIENTFQKWDASMKFRDDITTPKNTYEPLGLERLLKPFTVKSQYNNWDFKEINNEEFIDIDYFLNTVDKLVNLFQNVIYQDLFRNPDKPKTVMCPNINLCRILLIDKKIVRIRRHKQIKDLLRWDIMIELAISNKAFSYGILVVWEQNKPIDLKIVGIKSEDTYRINADGYRMENLVITTDPLFPYMADKGYYRMNEKDSVILPNPDEKVKEYLSRQDYTVSDTNWVKPRAMPNEFSCYESYGDTRVECENPYDTYYRVKPRGVWDRKCYRDEDCPFFKANKNYTNTFGGCNNGVCEMPIGIKRLGNRYYDIDSEPLCYNCPQDNPKCCKNQSNPDYRFSGDIFVRKMKESELEKAGLGLV